MPAKRNSNYILRWNDAEGAGTHSRVNLWPRWQAAGNNCGTAKENLDGEERDLHLFRRHRCPLQGSPGDSG